MQVLKICSAIVLFYVVTVHSQSCSEPDAQVLILGGGMAGVSAANKLSELGITDFLILEAQDRLGGRMRREELAPGVTVNLGANWIQGVDPAQPSLHPIFNLAERCGGLEGYYFDYGDMIVYNSSGSEISKSDALRYNDYHAALEHSIALCSSRQERGLPDISVREALTNGSWVPTTPEDDFVEWLGFDYCAGQPPDVSSLYQSVNLPTYSDFLQQPDNEGRDYFITDRRGYVHLVECLTSNFSTNANSDKRIRLEAVVTQIEHSNDCVCASALESGVSTRYCAPYGIVTFSLGVLKQQQMLFSPPLSDAKREALELFNMSMLQIVYAVYDERFWDDNVQSIGHVHPDRGYFPVILSALHQARSLNLTGFYFDGNIGEDISQQITQLFRSIYGDSVPEPSTVIYHDWLANPYFMGSYSNPRPGANRSVYSKLIAPEGRLYLAGEGTIFSYFGFVHGAYLSGIDTATAIGVQIQASSASKPAQLITLLAVCMITALNL